MSNISICVKPTSVIYVSNSCSSKVDKLAIQSVELEKDLAETIAFIKNVSRSAEKSVNSK